MSEAIGKQSDAERQSSGTAITLDDATVLLAEDEQTLRDAMRRLLQRLGVNVLAACNGAEALEILLGSAHVDVLMTDVMMPVMGGVELIGRARAVRPDLPVIMISGYTDIIEPAFHPRYDIVLEKPFSAESLARAIQCLIAD